MKNEFVLVTHAVLSNDSDIAGPAHTISSYLDKKKRNYLFLRHSIGGDGKTLIRIQRNSGITENIVGGKVKIPEPFVRLIEGYRTIKYFGAFFKKNKPIYIGIDPLNTLWGILLKKVGRIEKLITFTVDYSERRYENKILNTLYHYIDKTAMNNSDYVWVVSKRIYGLRLSQGIEEKKLFYIPNSPLFDKIKNFIKKDPDPLKLIAISTISKAVDFDLVLDAMKKLKKEFAQITLTIIGAGMGLENLKKKVKKMHLSSSITFMGSKSHEEVFEIIAKHGIGIALYTDDASWSFYSDSMKARDYLALGLPVVISGDIGTAYEINDGNAGIIIKRDKEEFVDAVRKIVSSKVFYKKLRDNAILLAKKNDMEKILDKIFKKTNL